MLNTTSPRFSFTSLTITISYWLLTVETLMKEWIQEKPIYSYKNDTRHILHHLPPTQETVNATTQQRRVIQNGVNMEGGNEEAFHWASHIGNNEPSKFENGSCISTFPWKQDLFGICLHRILHTLLLYGKPAHGPQLTVINPIFGDLRISQLG